MITSYDRIVVVGASSGIGAAVAKRYCLSGSTVYALARDMDKLSKVRKSLPKKHQSNFIIQKCDVMDHAQVDLVFKHIFSEGDVELVLSNAGIGYGKRFENYSNDEARLVVETNLLGTINVIKSSLANRKSQPIQIACTSSLAGKIGFPDMSVYSASKFGIEGLVESLRGEYNSKEVSFTIIRPGITDTPFFKKAGMHDYKSSVKDLKSYYSPEKVADLVFSKLNYKSKVIVIGNDKYFLALLPFIPFRYRFRVLDLINRL